MAVRICHECGAAFVPRYGGQVCCSDECKAARKKRLDDDRYRFRDQSSEIAFREERRGTCVGGTAFNPTVPISPKSYYYR